MKQLILLLFTGLMITGCAPQAVDPMESKITQSRDLTDGDKDGVTRRLSKHASIMTDARTSE